METIDIKLYTEKTTPRLEYIVKLILGQILGLKFDLITDKRKIGNTPLINYSREKINGSFHIIPGGLVTESGIRDFAPPIGSFNEIITLFPDDHAGDIPFDIFSASFFLVSRYEEYLPFIPDKHGRFPASSSVAYRSGFLQKPVIDLWAKQMALALIKKFPFLAFKRNEFKSLVTFDIDHAFAFRGKGFFRGAAGLVSDMIRGGGIERVQTVSGSSKDPFDVYDYIIEKIRENGSEATFFLPFGRRSEFDNNTPADSHLYIDLSRKLSEQFQTGIHFSYTSGTDDSSMSREMRKFTQALGSKPLISRQHYLLLSFPSTYRSLISNNIQSDFTMGYASEPGYRAGISRPFRFYDLGSEQETQLIISPFQIMDVTLKDYRKLSPSGAINIIEELVTETRNVGGLFTSIWHNSNLTDRDEWNGWRAVFEYVLSQ
jgi:hypothetical protein